MTKGKAGASGVTQPKKCRHGVTASLMLLVLKISFCHLFMYAAKQCLECFILKGKNMRVNRVFLLDLKSENHIGVSCVHSP
jgi:hypothetical protein